MRKLPCQNAQKGIKLHTQRDKKKPRMTPISVTGVVGCHMSKNRTRSLMLHSARLKAQAVTDFVTLPEQEREDLLGR